MEVCVRKKEDGDKKKYRVLMRRPTQVREGKTTVGTTKGRTWMKSNTRFDNSGK